MTYENLCVAIKSDILFVTLNRPERGNALDTAMVEELLDVVNHAALRDCSAMTLTDAGNHFCTGFDLSDINSQSDSDLLFRFVP